MNHNEFITWTKMRIAACAAQQKTLQQDGRRDEAAFMQIRSNVYGIFLSVCNALRGDMDAVRDRVHKIPMSWEASLAEAETHGDASKVHIERIKLETVADIRKALEE